MEEAPVPVIGDEMVGVLLEEQVHFGFAGIEDGAGFGLLGLVGGQDEIPDGDSEFDKGAGEFAECGKAGDLSLGDKPAALFDAGEFKASEDPKTQEGDEGDGEEENEAFSDGHGGSSKSEAEGRSPRSELFHGDGREKD
jgi:hypothetical protein